MIPQWLTSIMDTFHEKGINLVGICDGTSYTSFLPSCKRAIVFANGGRYLWDGFVEDIHKHPHHLQEYEHPFDEYVHRIIQSADPFPTQDRRWIRCAANEAEFLDFRTLAYKANMGTPSLMGMLIHPEYGLWIGMRAVLLTTIDIPINTTPMISPCSSCLEKNCISACPAHAVSSKGWNLQRCAQYHHETTTCADTCTSRLSCPVGAQHQHSPLQHRYHNAPHRTRNELANIIGLTDKSCGIALDWSKWTAT